MRYSGVCVIHHSQLLRAQRAKAMLIPKTLRWSFLRTSRKDDPEGKLVIAFMDRLVDVHAPRLEGESLGPAGHFEKHPNELTAIWHAIPKSRQVAETYKRLITEVICFFICL